MSTIVIYHNCQMFVISQFYNQKCSGFAVLHKSFNIMNILNKLFLNANFLQIFFVHFNQITLLKKVIKSKNCCFKRGQFRYTPLLICPYDVTDLTFLFIFTLMCVCCTLTDIKSSTRLPFH